MAVHLDSQPWGLKFERPYETPPGLVVSGRIYHTGENTQMDLSLNKVFTDLKENYESGNRELFGDLTDKLEFAEREISAEDAMGKRAYRDYSISIAEHDKLSPAELSRLKDRLSKLHWSKLVEWENKKRTQAEN